MKPLLPIGISAAVLLAGCDTGTQASTSSATQTALQELADNADAIASRMGNIQSARTAAARRMSSSDSIWSLAQESLCSGGSSSSSYEAGGIKIDWIGPGAGAAGTAGSCRLAESIHGFRQHTLDSIGRSDFQGSFHQYDTLSRKL